MLNLTHGPVPYSTAPSTGQPAIGVPTMKVPVEKTDPDAAPALPPQTNITNHMSAPTPGPTTISGGETEKKITPTPRPTALPIPSTAEVPLNTTLSTEPGPDYDTTPGHDDSDINPSVTTKLPKISTTPFNNIPPGMCLHWLLEISGFFVMV